MAKPTGRPRRDAVHLSRERVLAAALTRVDAHGMANLTMRSLAADLGVDPMALYHYFPHKAALINALVDQLVATFNAPNDPMAPWPERVRSFALAYHALTRAHPHLVLAIASDPAIAATAAALLNPALHSPLHAAGLTPDQIAAATGLLIDYIHGFALGLQHNPTASIEPGLAIILAGITSAK